VANSAGSASGSALTGSPSSPSLSALRSSMFLITAQGEMRPRFWGGVLDHHYHIIITIMTTIIIIIIIIIITIIIIIIIIIIISFCQKRDVRVRAQTGISPSPRFRYKDLDASQAKDQYRQSIQQR
jgi:hypothetical protein